MNQTVNTFLQNPTNFMYLCLTIVALAAFYFAHTSFNAWLLQRKDVHFHSQPAGDVAPTTPAQAPTTPPQPRRPEKAPPVGEIVIRRPMRKIAHVDQCNQWFECNARATIVQPYDWVVAQPGDVFVQKANGQITKLWVMAEAGGWLFTEKHPVLDGYVLQVTMEEPGWVKKETAQKNARVAAGSP